MKAIPAECVTASPYGCLHHNPGSLLFPLCTHSTSLWGEKQSMLKVNMCVLSSGNHHFNRWNGLRFCSYSNSGQSMNKSVTKLCFSLFATVISFFPAHSDCCSHSSWVKPSDRALLSTSFTAPLGLNYMSFQANFITVSYFVSLNLFI